MAILREVDGQLVLDDPEALGVVKAVAKHNCKLTFEENEERVVYFVKRMQELQKDPASWVIVLVNADDVNGKAIAGALMPGQDWQPFRDQGMIPYARGIAFRSAMQMCLEGIQDFAAADKLRAARRACVVIDHGVAEVFELGMRCLPTT
jgi:hypothetical protein